MDQVKTIFAPTFPVPILIGLTLLCTVLLVLGWRRVGSIPAKMVLVTVWLRIVFDAWPFITIQPIAAGITPNALLSVATIGVAMLAMDRRRLLMLWLWPLYGLLCVAFASYAVNGGLGLFFDTALRLIYLITLTCLVATAVRAEGPERLSVGLLCVLSSLIVLQGAAVALGLEKLTEADNSKAFVGGFGHEANYSIALWIGLLPLFAARKTNALLRLLILGIAFVALLAANYRTAILAFALPAAVFFVATSLRVADRRLRPALLAAAALVAVVGTATLPAISVGERWSEIVSIAADPLAKIRPPTDFSRVDRREASGRLYLFSVYYYGWADADDLRKIIGHGASSWIAISPVYAQNTLLNYLYEFGIAGVVMTIFFWLSLFGLAWQAPSELRLHFMLLNIGLVILNLATMPMTLLEGLQLYAVTGGFLSYFAETSWHRADSKADRRRRRRRRYLLSAPAAGPAEAAA